MKDYSKYKYNSLYKVNRQRCKIHIICKMKNYNTFSRKFKWSTSKVYKLQKDMLCGSWNLYIKSSAKLKWNLLKRAASCRSMFLDSFCSIPDFRRKMQRGNFLRMRTTLRLGRRAPVPPPSMTVSWGKQRSVKNG